MPSDREFATSFDGVSYQTYTPIQSEDDLARLIEGMKQYARSTEFDYEKAKEEALERSDCTTEEVGVDLNGQKSKMLRTRSRNQTLGYLEPFTRFVLMGHETIQICYFEFQSPPGSNKWMMQLQIVNNMKLPLENGAIEIAEAFVDMEKNVAIVEETPPHVYVLFQEVQR